MMYSADKDLAMGQGGEGVDSIGIYLSWAGDALSLYGQISGGERKPRTILN